MEPVRDRTQAQLTAVPVVSRRHPWRWVTASALLALAALIIGAVAGNENIAFDVIRDHLFSPDVLAGVGATLLLTMCSMTIAVVGGTTVALMRLSNNPVARVSAIAYIWLLRGVPILLLLILLFNLALVFPFLGVQMPNGDVIGWSTNDLVTPFIAAAVALGMAASAYYSEIVRGGILSIDAGQTEAALAVGMTSAMVFRKVVLPQALRIIIPPTGNEVIGMLKYSALASVIGFSELTGGVMNVAAVNSRVVEMLVVAAIWYLAMTTILSIGQYFLERRFGRGAQRRNVQRRAGRPALKRREAA